MSATALGKPLDRLDGRLKVTGSARFAAEWPVEKIAHAALVPAAVARGRLRELDTTAAEKAPGMLAVLTNRNAPPMKGTKVFDPANDVPGAAATSVEILHTQEISWDGQPIAVVVAQTLEQARHAAE
ncbi:MAG: xanthine dehydrogenase family protein molybdopterin-binding subunit, partial [Verrucomicrobiota bacterium]|nr:xanthine dehydrogenase family protein molybdopterin-binding subunit [Verrucomicrobiota bacterium]